jgi:hypothetical protein
MLSRVWQKLTKVMMMAIHQYGRPMANRFRSSKRAQATKWHPSHMCGDHSCFREVLGLLMRFRIIGGLLLFQNQARDQGLIFIRAKECSKRIAEILELWVMIKMSSRPDHWFRRQECGRFRGMCLAS